MKATNITLLPWIKHLANFKPGTDGIDMGTFKVFVHIAWLINDLRGCAGPFNAKEVGALYGACSQCTVCGSSAVKRMLGAVYYLCACRLAGGAHLAKFKETYKKVPDLANMADQPAPKARTHRALQESAKKAVLIMSRPKVHGEGKQNASDLQKQAMKGPNHFTDLFGIDSCLNTQMTPRAPPSPSSTSPENTRRKHIKNSKKIPRERAEVKGRKRKGPGGEAPQSQRVRCRQKVQQP
jgi:hypothetical protein